MSDLDQVVLFDASEDPQDTLLVLGQRRLPMLNRPLLQLLGGFQQPRYDR
jgi:hypothetical protein